MPTSSSFLTENDSVSVSRLQNGGASASMNASHPAGGDVFNTFAEDFANAKRKAAANEEAEEEGGAGANSSKQEGETKNLVAFSSVFFLFSSTSSCFFFFLLPS